MAPLRVSSLSANTPILMSDCIIKAKDLKREKM